MKKVTRKRQAQHEEPSVASLREMPELSPKAKLRPNPYAERIAKEGMAIHVRRGRPKKGEETGPTTPRSIRFPDAFWKDIETQAKADGLSVHAALREAVMAWLQKSHT